MKIHFIYDEDEKIDGVNNLKVASAIYDACKTLRPDIDIEVIGHLLESQALHDSRCKDYRICESRG